MSRIRGPRFYIAPPPPKKFMWWRPCGWSNFLRFVLNLYPLSIYLVVTLKDCPLINCKVKLTHFNGRTKIGNRETPGETWEIRKETGGKNRWNMRKRMGKWGETCRELPLGGILSCLVTSFHAASNIAGFTREWLPNMPYEQIST